MSLGYSLLETLRFLYGQYIVVEIEDKLVYHVCNQPLWKSVYWIMLYFYKFNRDHKYFRSLWDSKYAILYKNIGINVEYSNDKARFKHFVHNIVAMNCCDKMNANIYFYTMLDKCDLIDLESICREIVLSNIDGDFLEAGVWRGGSCILTKHVLNTLKSDQKLFLMDSLDSMNNFEANDEYDDNLNDIGIKMDNIITNLFKDITLCYKNMYNEENYNLINGISIDEIKSNFEKFNLNDDERNILVKGWINDQLVKKFADEHEHEHAQNDDNSCKKELKFSSIRIDLNLYKPTKYVLKHLYERLSIGGCIIFDR